VRTWAPDVLFDASVAMKLVDLWAATEQCIDSFEALPDTACVTEDEHVEAFTKPLVVQGKASIEESTFICETTFGVLRYRPFLDATVAGYCAARKKNKQNATGIAMLYYLVLYRFEEIGEDAFRQLVNKVMSNNRLAEMLELCLDDEALRTHLVPRWCTVFDDGFVHHHVLGTLRRIAPELERVAAHYRQKASGTASVKLTDDRVEDTTQSPSEKRAPEFRLFNFQKEDRTHAKPKLPPYEVRVLEALGQREMFPAIRVKCSDAEKRCIDLTKRGVKGASTLDDKVKEQNRRRERAIPFNGFASTARPLQLPQLLEEDRQRHEAAIRPLTTGKPDPIAVREQLSRIQDEVDVKLTHTALLREHQLFKGRVEAEEKARLRKQQELRDDSEFLAWKTKMDTEEEIERRLLVKQRKADLIAGDEAARAARVRREKENLQRTKADSEVTDQWRSDNQREAAAELRRLQEQAAVLKEDLKKGAERALDDMATQKKSAAAIVRDENHLRERAVAVQMELEKQRKQELIQEIKETHARFVARQQQMRATLTERLLDSTMNGKLEGMSIAELRQKLVDTKCEHKEWEEGQRASIAARKAAATTEEQQRREFVAEERRKMRESKDDARRKKREAEEQVQREQQQRENELALQLHDRLQAERDAKKQAAEARVRQERQRMVAAQLLSADAGAIESYKWHEMERGRQNALLARQNQSRSQRQRSNKLEADLTTLRERNIAASEAEHRSMIAATDAGFKTKKDRALREQAEDDSVRFAATKRMMDEARTLRQLTMTAGM
jgi:hypothetical protein